MQVMPLQLEENYVNFPIRRGELSVLYRSRLWDYWYIHLLTQLQNYLCVSTTEFFVQ